MRALASSFFTSKKASFFLFASSSRMARAARSSVVSAQSSASLASAFSMSSKSTSASFAAATASTNMASSAFSMAVWSCSNAARLSRSCLAASSRRASSRRDSTPPIACLSCSGVERLLVITARRRPSEHAITGVAVVAAVLAASAKRSFSTRIWLSSAVNLSFSCAISRWSRPSRSLARFACRSSSFSACSALTCSSRAATSAASGAGCTPPP
mmetsp:Transcript_9396/g.25442  ORF Transcript_9396/g.25442 Transcript_9396/m.25442 type:complete len:214 (+) Transcript_9396:1123-1764(+)